MKRTAVPIFSLALLAALVASPALAVPTEVTVRVLAKDAKFVGTSMGGVRVVLRDADTGAILASGVTAGGTGDTAKIMVRPRAHGEAISTEGSAEFTATLDLAEPTLVQVEAYGPLGQRQAAARVTSTQWVVPGKPVTGGDAWMLELPGFVVDVLAPPTHVRLGGAPTTIPVRANVVMMCGCPVEPGGLWDANRFEVAAIVERDGETLGTFPLKYAGTTSQFAGGVPADAPGVYDLTVYAYDPTNGNTGLDRVDVLVSK